MLLGYVLTRQKDENKRKINVRSDLLSHIVFIYFCAGMHHTIFSKLKKYYLLEIIWWYAIWWELVGTKTRVLILINLIYLI